MQRSRVTLADRHPATVGNRLPVLSSRYRQSRLYVLPVLPVSSIGMTLQELRAAHPQWTIEPVGLDLVYQSGPWRFRAMDPDDAEKEIERRERAYERASWPTNQAV